MTPLHLPPRYLFTMTVRSALHSTLSLLLHVAYKIFHSLTAAITHACAKFRTKPVNGVPESRPETSERLPQTETTWRKVASLVRPVRKRGAMSSLMSAGRPDVNVPITQACQLSWEDVNYAELGVRSATTPVIVMQSHAHSQGSGMMPTSSRTPDVPSPLHSVMTMPLAIPLTPPDLYRLSPGLGTHDLFYSESWPTSTGISRPRKLGRSPLKMSFSSDPTDSLNPWTPRCTSTPAKIWTSTPNMMRSPVLGMPSRHSLYLSVLAIGASARMSGDSLVDDRSVVSSSQSCTVDLSDVEIMHSFDVAHRLDSFASEEEHDDGSGGERGRRRGEEHDSCLPVFSTTVWRRYGAHLPGRTPKSKKISTEGSLPFSPDILAQRPSIILATPTRLSPSSSKLRRSKSCPSIYHPEKSASQISHHPERPSRCPSPL